MATLVGSARRLPPNPAITDRSHKFYDGTYEWDSNGFTDEHAVYREFDCCDPLARAPTPLPPMFPDDEEDDRTDNATDEAIYTTEGDSIVTATNDAYSKQDTPCPKPNGTTAITVNPRTPAAIRKFAINFLANTKQSKMVRQNELIIGAQGSGIISTAPGGALDTGAGLQVGYELHRVTPPAKEESNDVKMPDTPPESPVNTVSGVRILSPASTISTLSPVPSNLSDQDNNVGVGIKGAFGTARSTPSLPTIMSTASMRPSKRATASKASPRKRKNDSVEDFTLLELHSGAFMRNSGRRRSVRRA